MCVLTYDTLAKAMTSHVVECQAPFEVRSISGTK